VSRFPFPVSRFPFPVSRFPFPVSRFPFPVQGVFYMGKDGAVQRTGAISNSLLVYNRAPDGNLIEQSNYLTEV
ncbi:hypothetical protein ACPV3U_22105, partial [Vibrio rotiferianus]